MSELLSKRLLFLTGKGGVGKTTVAIALGMTASRAGLRTVIAEVAGQDRVASTLADSSVDAPSERELLPGLWTISIDPELAMREYLADQLPSRTVADALGQSRAFGYLAAATPGMRELLTIGKVWELCQVERRTPGARTYDLVIVDGPASGHGLGVLRTPQTFAGLARVGPIARHARIIGETLADESVTGVVAVARAQETPVSETLSLADELRTQLGLALDRVIVNAVYPKRFSASELRRVTAALSAEARPGPQAALRAALSADARVREQRRQLRRLRIATSVAPIVLPFVFARDLGGASHELLSRRLEARL